MFMRIVVDTRKCIGAGQCVMNAPDVFGQDIEGRVVLLTETPESDAWDEVRQAAAQCPIHAIFLSDC
jgi:ferredoxin